MRKLNGPIAAVAFFTILSAATALASAGEDRPDIPSVPEAWSPEGRAPYTPLAVPEAWSPEGRSSS